MGRLSRDARIETREARYRLKVSKEPYWRQIHPGLFIGYYKGSTGGAWFQRRLVDGRYVLIYAQAHRKALALADTAVKRENGYSYTVAGALTDYMTWYKAQRKAHAQTELAIKAHILPALGNKRVADLEARYIREWHHALAESPARNRGTLRELDPGNAEAVRRRRSSANRVLTILKAALNHAWHEGRAPSRDAWSWVKPFRGVDAPRIRYLSAAEATRLINACPSDFRRLVQAALFTGCRYGELIRLQCADFHPEAGTALARETKSDKARHIPLTDEGQRFFERVTAGRRGGEVIFLRDDGEPWGKSHQARPLKTACEAARIAPAISFHDLRHTYASLLAMKGVPEHVIAEALGHSDTRMTHRHYAHLMPSYVAETIRANLPCFGTEPDNVTPMRKRTP